MSAITPTRAILFCLMAIFLITVMNGIIKALSPGYDTLEIAFLRYAFGASLALGLALWHRPALPDRAAMPMHLARGALGAISGTTFFYALRSLSLADAFTISFLAPLFVVILSLLFLREVPRRIDLVALALGFGGMLVIVSGAEAEGGGRSLFGIANAAVSAITYALTLVMLRALAQRESILNLVLIQHVVSAILMLPLALVVWKMPQITHLLGFALAASLGVVAHLLMARAYGAAPASQLVPLEYSSLVHAAAIDLVWFAHGLTVDTLIGAGLIVIGALLASRR